MRGVVFQPAIAAGHQLNGALALCVALAAGSALAGNYKVEFAGTAHTIAGEAPPFSCTVKVVHDAFFGEPTVKSIARDCKGADGSKLKSPLVYACYDIMQGSVRRSTRCVGPLIEMDMAGSPNWADLFPGLSASEAKALVKGGFSIANVRLSGKPMKPGAAAPAATVATASPTDATAETGTTGAAPASDTGLTAAPGSPSARCTPPNINGSSGPWPGCLNPTIGTTNQAVLTTDGVRHGLNAVETEVEWRLEGTTAWRSMRDAGLVARPSLSAEPCRSWEVRARTRCDDGSVSDWSVTLRMTTTCPAPSHVRAEPTGPGSASVSWRRDVGICSEVQGMATEVQLAEANGAWQEIVPGPGGRIEGLTPGRPYSVRARFTYPGGATSKWDGTSFTAR